MLKQHPQIAQANYLTLAQEAVTEARSGFFPNANLYANAVGADSPGTRILAGGLNNPSVFGRGAGRIQVNQLITDFGRTANLTASSKFQALAPSQSADATREQVLLQVDVSYCSTVIKAQAVLRVAQQTLDTRQTLFGQITALATNDALGLDVSFAGWKFRRCWWNAPKTTPTPPWQHCPPRLAGEFHHLFQLAEQIPAAGTVTTNIDGLVQTALAHRPELLSLRDDRNAALHFAKSQRAFADR